MYRRQERWAIAATHYERGLAGSPQETGAIFDLAYCYEQLGRDADALRTYRRYIERVEDSDPDAAARAEERVIALEG